VGGQILPIFIDLGCRHKYSAALPRAFENKRGPNTERCSTPQVTELRDDSVLPIHKQHYAIITLCKHHFYVCSENTLCASSMLHDLFSTVSRLSYDKLIEMR